MSFLENVHYWFSGIEEQNRSKAEVLLVKKLFIDSFQSVSHEFGTALNCINNLSELACLEMPSKAIEQIMNPIKYNSTLIQFLINDILDHHMILQNTFILEMAPFSLPALRDELLSLFSLQVQYKHLQYEINVDPTIPETICTDRNRIQTILMTMIRNAVKFTQSGSVIVNLKLSPFSTANGTASASNSSFCIDIEVSDTGVGLDDNESARLRQLLQFGFCNEPISKNSLSNGIGGLRVSNLIAIRLSGCAGRGIKFHKNPDHTKSGSVFSFSVECSKSTQTHIHHEFQARPISTSKHPKPQQSDTILDDQQPFRAAAAAAVAAATSVIPTIQTDSPRNLMYLQASSISYGFEYPTPLTPINANQVYVSAKQIAFPSVSPRKQHSNQLGNSYIQHSIHQSTQMPYLVSTMSNLAMSPTHQNQQQLQQQASFLQTVEQMQDENFLVENLKNNLNFILEAGIASNTKESTDLERSTATPNPGNSSPQQQQLYLASKKSLFNLPRTPLNRFTFDAPSTAILGQSPVHSSMNNNNQIGQLSLKDYANITSISGSHNSTEALRISPQKKCTQSIYVKETHLFPKKASTSQLEHNSSSNHSDNQFTATFPQQTNSILTPPRKEENALSSQLRLEVPLIKGITQEHSPFRQDQALPRLSSLIKQSVDTPQFYPHLNSPDKFFRKTSSNSFDLDNENIESSKKHVFKESIFGHAVHAASNGSGQPRITFGTIGEDDKQKLNVSRLLLLAESSSFRQTPKSIHTSIRLQLPMPFAEEGESIDLRKSSLDLSNVFDEIQEDTLVVVPDERVDQHEVIKIKLDQIQEDIEASDKTKQNVLRLNRLSATCCVKVLCVDDEPFNHFVMKALLKSRKIECDTALDGSEAVDKFKSRNSCQTCGLSSYCLVLMDLNMPVKNGFEATAEIKAIARKKNNLSQVAVFICSAFVDLPSKLRAHASGSDHFIQKPINQNTLFEVIGSMFQI